MQWFIFLLLSFKSVWKILRQKLTKLFVCVGSFWYFISFLSFFEDEYENFVFTP